MQHWETKRLEDRARFQSQGSQENWKGQDWKARADWSNWSPSKPAGSRDKDEIWDPSKRPPGSLTDKMRGKFETAAPERVLKLDAEPIPCNNAKNGCPFCITNNDVKNEFHEGYCCRECFDVGNMSEEAKKSAFPMKLQATHGYHCSCTSMEPAKGARGTNIYYG